MSRLDFPSISLQHIRALTSISGAGSSKGRTSWTARPELADYISFVGFLVYYVHDLDPPSAIHPVGQSSATLIAGDCHIDPLIPVAQSSNEYAETSLHKLTLLLAGYSYGSLITARLPPTEVILARFASADEGSAEAEIKLRALHLSREWNRNAQLDQHRRILRLRGVLGGSSHSLGAAVGGEESKIGTQRKSYESRRSVDIFRRSIDRSRRRLGSRPQSSDDTQYPSPSQTSFLSSELLTPQTYYLLVSPLLPPVSLFASMFSRIAYVPPDQGRHGSSEDGKLVRHGTLAIYGDKDFFTSQRKLRKWAEHLRGVPGSKFNFREITGAGHFWHEQGVEAQLRSCIFQWLHEVIEE